MYLEKVKDLINTGVLTEYDIPVLEQRKEVYAKRWYAEYTREKSPEESAFTSLLPTLKEVQHLLYCIDRLRAPEEDNGMEDVLDWYADGCPSSPTIEEKEEAILKKEDGLKQEVQDIIDPLDEGKLILALHWARKSSRKDMAEYADLLVWILGYDPDMIALG